MQTFDGTTTLLEACKYALPAFQAQAAGKRQLTAPSRVRGREELTPRGQLARGRGDSCSCLAQNSTPCRPQAKRQTREKGRSVSAHSRTDARRRRRRPLRARFVFPVSQAAAYPNSKWPPGSWKLPAPNDPFLFPRRTQRGCLPLVTTTPTPTPGRRPRGSSLAVIAREDQAGRDGK